MLLVLKLEVWWKYSPLASHGSHGSVGADQRAVLRDWSRGGDTTSLHAPIRGHRILLTGAN